MPADGVAGKASLLVVTSSYPSLRAPYNGVFVAEQVAALRARGHDLAVLAPHVFREDPVRSVADDVPVRRFRFLSGQRLLSEYSGIPVARMATYVSSGVVATRRCLSSVRPDVVHAHWIVPTGVIAALAVPSSTPLVLTVHGTDVRLSAQGSPMVRRLARLALDRADAIIAVSHALKTRLVEELRVEASKVHVVPMGVDAARFSSRGRRLARRSLGLPDAAPVALFVGGLLPAKGVRVLVDAWDAVRESQPEARLLIVGRGPLEDELREWASGRQAGDVEVVGPVPHQQLPQLMDAADCLVLPTLSEGLGMVLLEAGAMGLPVVTSDVGGCREAAGFCEANQLVPPAEPRLLAEAVARALARPSSDVRSSNLTGEGARFTQAAVIGEIERVYSQLT